MNLTQIIEKSLAEYDTLGAGGVIKMHSMDCIPVEHYKQVIKRNREFLSEKIKEAYEAGHTEATMTESIKRYNQAKEDGTLDKHFPKIN